MRSTDAVVRSSDVVKSDFGDVRGPIDDSLIPVVRAVPGVAKESVSIGSVRAQIVRQRQGQEVGPSGGNGPPAIGDVWNGAQRGSRAGGSSKAAARRPTPRS